MARGYRHIQEYEKEIIELKNNGYTGRQICEKFGFSKKQYEKKYFHVKPHCCIFERNKEEIH